MKFTFSLYFQLTVLFVLISVISAVGAGTINYLDSHQIIKEQFGNYMTDIANTISKSLSDRTEDATSAIMRLSRNKALLNSDVERLNDILKVAVESSSLFNNIYYFSPEGPLISLAYADGRSKKLYMAENFHNYANKEKTHSIYLDLMHILETKTPVFSSFFKSHTGRLMSSYITPVANESGDIVGILSCGIVLDRSFKLLEMMNLLKPHSNGYIALADNKGDLLLKAGDIPDTLCFKDTSESGKQRLTSEIGYLQSSFIINDSSLRICIGIPDSAISELLIRLRKGTLIFTLGVAFAASLFASLAASVLISPLKALVNGLRSLQDGKPGTRIDRRASGEIAEAISAYNELRNKLRKDIE